MNVRGATLLLAALLVACAHGQAQPTLPPAGPPVSADAPVVVYGATWCRHTRAALDWFEARGVPTRFRNVETDVAAYDEMMARMQSGGIGGQGIPVLDVRGRVLLGFHAEEAERALRD